MTTRRLWEAHIAKLQAAGRQVVETATRAGFARREGETKYHSRATHVDGIRFASQLEADRYKELVLLRKAGEVAWFIRQAPFDCGGGIVYRADFLVVWNLKGRMYGAVMPEDFVEINDCKGVMTPASRVKIAVVEERYGIHIRILKRADVAR